MHNNTAMESKNSVHSVTHELVNETSKWHQFYARQALTKESLLETNNYQQ